MRKTTFEMFQNVSNIILALYGTLKIIYLQRGIICLIPYVRTACYEAFPVGKNQKVVCHDRHILQKKRCRRQKNRRIGPKGRKSGQ